MAIWQDYCGIVRSMPMDCRSIHLSLLFKVLAKTLELNETISTKPGCWRRPSLSSLSLAKIEDWILPTACMEKAIHLVVTWSVKATYRVVADLAPNHGVWILRMKNLNTVTLKLRRIFSNGKNGRILHPKATFLVACVALLDNQWLITLPNNSTWHVMGHLQPAKSFPIKLAEICTD